MQPIRMISALLALPLILLAGCADVNKELVAAAEQGDTATVEALLAKGADANTQTTGGMTVLILVAQKGHTDAVQALLAKGADLNARDNDGGTALIHAAENGY
ncbi:MAG: ankyrin repeat domain-containing protein, partial [Acidobacteriota bacterium]